MPENPSSAASAPPQLPTPQSTSPPPVSPGPQKSGKGKGKLTEEEIVRKLEYLRLKALQRNIKTVNPAKATSEIHKAIQADDWYRLEYLIELGDFSADRESTVAKILGSRSMGGLSVLTNLAVDLSAPRCLVGLFNWAKNPDNNFWISERDMFNYAKEAALRNGNLICCLTLMEKCIIGGQDRNDIIDLANLLFPLAKSYDVAYRLGVFMYGAWKYVFFFPHLVNFCSDPRTHPLIIAGTIQFAIDSRERLDTFDCRTGRLTKVPLPDDDVKRTPLSAAASVLNIAAMDIILHDRRSRAGFEELISNHQDTEEYNPLYTLVDQKFPFMTPAETARDGDDSRLIKHPDDPDVYFQVHSKGYAIFEGIRLLSRAMRESPTSRVSPRTIVKISHRASEIFAATLRELVIRKIRRHLPPKMQAQLIKLKKQPPQGDIKKDDDSNGGDDDDDAKKYTFRSAINGSILTAYLERYDILLEDPFTRSWAYLIHAESLEEIIALIERKIPDAKVNSATGILYEYILDPRSREDIPPPPPRSPREPVGKEDNGGLRGSWTGIVNYGASSVDDF